MAKNGQKFKTAIPQVNLVVKCGEGSTNSLELLLLIVFLP